MTARITGGELATCEELATTHANLAEVAIGTQGQIAVLGGVAHRTPAEAPDRVAPLLQRFAPNTTTSAWAYAKKCSATPAPTAL